MHQGCTIAFADALATLLCFLYISLLLFFFCLFANFRVSWNAGFLDFGF